MKHFPTSHRKSAHRTYHDYTHSEHHTTCSNTAHRYGIHNGSSGNTATHPIINSTKPAIPTMPLLTVRSLLKLLTSPSRQGETDFATSQGSAKVQVAYHVCSLCDTSHDRLQAACKQHREASSIVVCLCPASYHKWSLHPGETENTHTRTHTLSLFHAGNPGTVHAGKRAAVRADPLEREE
jgi:hypothetical protein